MVPHKNVEIVYPIEVKMFMECLLMRFFMLAWGSLRAKIATEPQDDPSKATP